LLAPAAARADLASYVKAPDASFAFSVDATTDIPGGGKVLRVRLTSQTWQGIAWTHWLHLVRPEKVTHPEFSLLVVSGGSIHKEPPSRLPGEVLYLGPLATKTGSVIAVLSQVPNQPLFDDGKNGGLKEDALIAYTFKKYYETHDETWPCLLPMTKSAVRAMDAVQAVLKEKFSQEVKSFVVTGASKRGWTTWLTGAVDPRVIAIAPMVIDTLNMPQQMRLQVKSFGSYSEQIADYTRLGLQEKLSDPQSRGLLDLVDPYSYRAKLEKPKLIVLGTNDRYWPVDAAKLYFGDLPGEKLLYYMPNAGHSLGPDAVQVIGAFYQTVIAGEPRPRFTWKYSPEGKGTNLSISAEDAPEKAEIWKAAASTRDFRDSVWSGEPLAPSRSDGRRFEARVPPPAKGYSAVFARLTYHSSLGHDYTLATNVEVLGD
jgi:PhoPQ-activated pathogenicity-related protein